MKLTRLLFLTYLIFISALIAVAQDDIRPTATWQVQKYDIAATLPSTESDRALTSKATLIVKNITSSAASTLSLRISPSAEVSAVTVNGASADFTKREEKVGVSGSL